VEHLCGSSRIGYWPYQGILGYAGKETSVLACAICSEEKKVSYHEFRSYDLSSSEEVQLKPKFRTSGLLIECVFFFGHLYL